MQKHDVPKVPKQEEGAPESQDFIEYNPVAGSIGGALGVLKAHGHPEFEEKVKNTVTGGPSSLSDDELKTIMEILEPEGMFPNFMTGYAEARWGGGASAVWRSGSGYQQENIAAKFWWRLTPEERNNFYLRMSKVEAETFWNTTKLDDGEAPVSIEVKTNPNKAA